MPAVANTSDYTFLAHPPQKQKKRPGPLRPVAPVNVLLPLPTASLVSPASASKPTRHRRSSTFTSITCWAAAVHPGTPAAQSPPPSAFSRRGSVSSALSYANRTSVHTRANSYSSILHLLDSQQDPSRVAVVQFPDTMAPVSENVNPVTPPADEQTFTKALKRIRSFGNLTARRTRARSVSTAVPASPTRQRSKSIAQPAPKSKSSSKTKGRSDLPPTLQHAVAFQQFFGGGSYEDNLRHVNRRLAKAEAKLSGKNTANTQLVISDPYRDSNGRAWRDRDEALEYTSLLRQEGEAADDDGDMDEWTHLENESRNVLAKPSSPGFEDSFAPVPVLRPKKSRPDVRDLFNNTN